MGPLALLGLLDRTGISDRAGLPLPEGWRDAASAVTNPQAFLTSQIKNAATNAIAESSPEAKAGIAALNIPQAFQNDLKQSVINGAVADSPVAQQFAPVQDYQTPDLIRAIQAAIPQVPTYDNVDIGGGWNPSGYVPDMAALAQFPDLNAFNYQPSQPAFDYSEFDYSMGGKV